MHGCGNDYVYVDCFAQTLEDPARVARVVSDRHFGIGSDGLILIKPSDKADFMMDMYNADGSRGKMCGNGIRCLAKYVYDHGLTDKTSISVETLSGVRHLELEVENGKVANVRVNMGAPVLRPDLIPADFPDGPVVARPLSAGGREYRVTCVSMGNPHCVVFMDEDVRSLELEKIGPAFEHHPAFPEGVNTEFANADGRGRLRMRVWERGSGETMACGTGACATLVAAVLNGLADDKADIVLSGGTLTVEWDRAADEVYMTGPAEAVFDGEIEL